MQNVGNAILSLMDEFVDMKLMWQYTITILLLIIELQLKNGVRRTLFLIFNFVFY